MAAQNSRIIADSEGVKIPESSLPMLKQKLFFFF